jgi:hypothetical protein
VTPIRKDVRDPQVPSHQLYGKEMVIYRLCMKSLPDIEALLAAVAVAVAIAVAGIGSGSLFRSRGG